jgi:methylamine utilization protein MauE
VSEALAPPFMVAALLLCVAGLAKLRAPARAAAALHAPAPAVRVLAIGEVALGVACVMYPTPALAAALAALYATFAVVAVKLSRGHVACGCFGDNDLPVSPAHVVASVLLGTLAAAAAVASPRGVSWLASQPVVTAAVLAVGIAGAVYATVLLYTAVPRAWTVWSAE